MTTPRTLFAILLLAVPAAARAQYNEPGLLGGGSRIRVAAPAVAGDPVIGRLLVLSRDTLLMSAGSGDARITLPLAAVRSIDLSEGRDRRGWAVKGAGIGLVAGGLLGGLSIGNADRNDLAALAGFFAGAVIGTPLGAAVGAIVAPERWRSVWTREYAR